MSSNPYGAYVENTVLSASPLEGVRLLYEAAIEAIQDARGHLARRNIRERSDRIMRAVEILTELAGALDHERGGELSQRLAALYDYVQRLLLKANFEQADAPMAEAVSLLETLLDAWKQVAAAAAAPVSVTAPAWAAEQEQPESHLDLTL